MVRVCGARTDNRQKKIKVVHTRLPSLGFRSWSWFLAVSLQVTWVINPTVDCHYFPPGLQLPPQPLRGLLPVLLLGEQRHNGCEQFAYDCHPTSSRLRFEPGPFCARVQHANHSATEPPYRLTRGALSTRESNNSATSGTVYLLTFAETSPYEGRADHRMRRVDVRNVCVKVTL